MMFERVEHKGRLLSIIVHGQVLEPGVTFVTPPELSQQVGCLRHPPGHLIEPHVHKPIRRRVHRTQEVLVIKRGKLRVDFYDERFGYVESRVLETGDVILLVEGGHGFEVLEELEMFEVKQGPYVGERDKKRLRPGRSARGADSRRSVSGRDSRDGGGSTPGRSAAQ